MRFVVFFHRLKNPNKRTREREKYSWDSDSSKHTNDNEQINKKKREKEKKGKKWSTIKTDQYLHFMIIKILFIIISISKSIASFSDH